MTIPDIPRILAVDDVPDNLFLIEAILSSEKAPYQVSCVESGRSAIESVEESPPDLILLDVMMPDITGYEVLRHIRQNDRLPYIPVLLVTATDPVRKAHYLEAGADGVIHKPFDIQDLVERVQASLSAQCECGCGCEG